jgi:S-adenosylmethionine decarboxylase
MKKDDYTASPVGNEIACVMFGIDSSVLNDGRFLRQLLKDSLKQDEFNILGESNHQFTPQGFSSIMLLSESHVSIHTFPEYNSLHFYLYTCRKPNDGRKTFEYFRDKLKPSKVEFKENKVVVADKIVVQPISKGH